MKPARDNNNRDTYRDSWWIFGEPRGELRPALEGLSRYIVTIETARHRFFQLLAVNVRADNKLVVMGMAAPEALAVLTSRPHTIWAMAAGGWLGVGNDSVYVKSRTFDPFPFPDLSGEPVTKSRLAELGERLDAFRKERLAEHDLLTMTGLYNVLERVRDLEWAAGPGRAVLAARDEAEPVPPLTEKERAIYEAGLVGVLKDMHDEIDRLVFAAYGWDDLADRLVSRPGATTPSPFKTEEQQAAEQEVLVRLVALNHARAAEEARGKVRWLRPDYQIPRLGAKVARPAAEEEEDIELVLAEGPSRPKWPAEPFAQIRSVIEVLAKAPGPVPPEAVASAFDGRNTSKRKARVEEVLATLVTTGMARTGGDGTAPHYFIPR